MTPSTLELSTSRAAASEANAIGLRKEEAMNWQGLERLHIALKLPLLVVRGSRGVLACGYLNVETFNKTGEVGAIVTGVKTFEDMLDARVTSVSAAAEKAGIQIGMSGAEAIERIR